MMTIVTNAGNVPLYSLRDSELKLSEHTASVLRIGVVPLYSLRDSELKR